MGRKWLTPDNPLTTPPDVTRIITVPETMIPFVSGAFFLLTLEENWEEHGTYTPSEMADLFTEFFYSYSVS